MLAEWAGLCVQIAAIPLYIPFYLWIISPRAFHYEWLHKPRAKGPQTTCKICRRKPSNMSCLQTYCPRRQRTVSSLWVQLSGAWPLAPDNASCFCTQKHSQQHRRLSWDSWCCKHPYHSTKFTQRRDGSNIRVLPACGHCAHRKYIETVITGQHAVTRAGCSEGNRAAFSFITLYSVNTVKQFHTPVRPHFNKLA